MKKERNDLNKLKLSKKTISKFESKINGGGIAASGTIITGPSGCDICPTTNTNQPTLKCFA